MSINSAEYRNLKASFIEAYLEANEDRHVKASDLLAEAEDVWEWREQQKLIASLTA
jgi:hypothetical protein